MTLEAWVYPTVVNSSWRDVIYKADDNYYLEATSTQGGAPGMGGTFSANPLYGTGALTVNAWTHLAATYDRTTMRLYVNGTQVASRAQTGNIATSTNALQIGGDSFYGQYFQGNIDEVRVYNRALSQAEIQTDMNTPQPAAPSAGTLPGGTGAIAEQRIIPTQYALGQNFPNPFNPTTVVRYDVPENSSVKLVVYDILGRQVRVLVNEPEVPGSYDVRFDGTNLASGVYIIRMTAGNYIETRKMLLTK
jgi:hypothetical protein